MLSSDGTPKVTDSGLAKLCGEPFLTRDGSTVGTAAYMSPEQIRGEDVDHRSDIFSFGVVFYEMLVGQPPFKGAYEPAVTYSIVNVEPEPLEDVPPELAEVVMKALAGLCFEALEDQKRAAQHFERFVELRQKGAEVEDAKRRLEQIL